MTPHDQRHIDRAGRGQAAILEALSATVRAEPLCPGAPPSHAWTLAELASWAREHGLEADSNDIQVWAAMLSVKGRIQTVPCAGPVRYELAPEASS